MARKWKKKKKKSGEFSNLNRLSKALLIIYS